MAVLQERPHLQAGRVCTLFWVSTAFPMHAWAHVRALRVGAAVGAPASGMQAERCTQAWAQPARSTALFKPQRRQRPPQDLA